MTDPDPELREILIRKAFFDKVNRNGVTLVEDNTIDDIIKSSPIPVLVDFSADAWCHPCQVMAPVYEELSREFANKILFVKINTDHNPNSSAKYRIFSVPTFMMFNSGNRVAQRAGAAPKAKFKAWIDEIMKKMQ
jgi:thioredoxin